MTKMGSLSAQDGRTKCGTLSGGESATLFFSISALLGYLGASGGPLWAVLAPVGCLLGARCPPCAPFWVPRGYHLGAIGTMIGFHGHFSRVSLICEPFLWPCVMVLAVLWALVGPSVQPSIFFMFANLCPWIAPQSDCSVAHHCDVLQEKAYFGAGPDSNATAWRVGGESHMQVPEASP